MLANHKNISRKVSEQEVPVPERAASVNTPGFGMGAAKGASGPRGLTPDVRAAEMFALWA